MKNARLLAAFLLAILPSAGSAQTELSAPAISGESVELPAGPQPGLERQSDEDGAPSFDPAPTGIGLELDGSALTAPEASPGQAPAELSSARAAGAEARASRAALAAPVGAPLPAAGAKSRHASIRATIDVAGADAEAGEGRKGDETQSQAERLGLLFDLGGWKTGDVPIAIEIAPALEALKVEAGGTSARGARIVELSGRAPALSAERDSPRPVGSFKPKWEAWTQSLTILANAFFLPFSLPQIYKNAVNIHHGASSALAGLPWTGYSSGILGNLFLMSVAFSLRDKSWAAVQAVGWTTSFVILSQVLYAGYMPAWAYAGLSGVIAAFTGMSLADRRGWLRGGLKKAWDRTVRGAGWLATFLFMYAPVSFLWSIFSRPASAAGMAYWGFVLGMLGNLVMLPQAVRTKNFMWFVSSAWGVGVGGAAILASLFFMGQVPFYVMLSVALVLPAGLAFLAAMTKKYFGLKSILQFRFRD